MSAISIIVPVYNVEKYLRECLDSIINQTFSDFELLLIDDGSTDDSLSIIEEYAQRDNRISIYRQKNLYAGVARNNGLLHATGKYVIFLDSDDFFSPNMLEVLFREAEEQEAEIVQFGYYEYDDSTKKIKKSGQVEKKNRLASPKDLGINIFSICRPVPWDKLILRSFLNDTNLKYQGLKNTNDEFFNRMIVTLAQRIYLTKDRFVYYRVNNSGSLQGSSKKDLFCIALAVSNLKHELETRGMYKGVLKEAYLNYALSCFDRAITNHGSNESRKQLYQYLHDNGVPCIFDSIQDTVKDEKVSRIMKSIDYEDYLTSEMLYMIDYWVPQKSKAYQLGKKLLKIPKTIKKLR